MRDETRRYRVTVLTVLLLNSENCADQKSQTDIAASTGQIKVQNSNL
jgi:hypothetical protein